jgi:hypothetical protein
MASFWAKALQSDVLPVPGGPCSRATLFQAMMLLSMPCAAKRSVVSACLTKRSLMSESYTSASHIPSKSLHGTCAAQPLDACLHCTHAAQPPKNCCGNSIETSSGRGCCADVHLPAGQFPFHEGRHSVVHFIVLSRSPLAKPEHMKLWFHLPEEEFPLALCWTCGYRVCDTVMQPSFN